MSDAKDKERQTRADLGPRLGFAPKGAAARRYAVLPSRTPRATGSSSSSLRSDEGGNSGHQGKSQ